MTEQDWSRVVHALLAVSPSGGGSESYHLARTIADQIHVTVDDARVVELQHIAAAELKE